MVSIQKPRGFPGRNWAPSDNLFCATSFRRSLGCVYFFLFRLPLLLFALLSFRVVGYQVVQFRCRQRHKKVQHIHPGGSFSSPRRLPRKRAHTKTKQTQLGHKEKKRKEKKRKDTQKKECVCWSIAKREREKNYTVQSKCHWFFRTGVSSSRTGWRRRRAGDGCISRR